MLENFPLHVKNKGTEFNGILEELNNIHFLSVKRSSKVFHRVDSFCFTTTFYNSCQTYSLYLEQLPLPSLELLWKLANGGVDAAHVIKILLENDSKSEDCALIVDEMYLQKSVQYHRGYYVEAEAEGNLYKGVVVFLVVSLKNSVPCIVKALSETSISGYWLSEEIDRSITNLK